MDFSLDGRKIRSVADFHVEISQLLNFGPFYGKNLSALWDRLSRDVERPVRLHWRRAAVSRDAMGREAFDKIGEILRRAEDEDRRLGMVERFEVMISE